MRTITAAVLGVLVSACASSSSTSSSPMLGTSTTRTSQTIMGSGSTGLTMTSDAVSARIDVALPMDQAWNRLQAAYSTLGIKVTELDHAAHSIGNLNLKARRRIGDVPLMKALNCGMSGTGPNAETYELTLSFQSRLAPAAGGVVVETFIVGTGQNPLTNAVNTVSCSSMGVLEKRIVELMTAK